MGSCQPHRRTSPPQYLLATTYVLDDPSGWPVRQYPTWLAFIHPTKGFDVLSVIQPHLLSIPQPLIYPVARQRPLRRPVLETMASIGLKHDATPS
ncbi:hypothetical protein SCLCIDRAFT_863795 [Scleroderma citrinum Foug A]|uniref:Uncharacterized protein n=1 Tax=Scleroderma citrinum Foug A TaxID=1036808 RepID=A0A0C3A9X0_9AGAM|nr:hypothetical protein SCLCIDRAFT_863795 [Scleroderma citrinum Foug A]